MKYYTKDLWRGVNSCDRLIREKSNILWLENARRYQEYFETIKPYFSKKFMNEYYKYKWFHDFRILQINISMTSGNKTTVKLIIENDSTVFNIYFEDVKSYIINVKQDDFINWGYSEFEVDEHKRIKINILCDFENEIQISFKKVMIRKGS